MLLQQLVAHAETLPDAVPSGYQRKLVRYVIDLAADGRGLQISQIGDDPKNRGMSLAVPHMKRANGIRPILLADTATYTLGIPREKDDPQRVKEQVAAYRAVVERCAVATGDPSVQAIARFLSHLPESLPSLPDNFDPSATMTFEVDGVRPINLPAVQRFWAAALGGGEEEADGPLFECIACGQIKPAVRIHPLKIKGILAGQSGGTDLISANNDAYFSYGLESSLIAPTCADCAEKYANGLNDLLAKRSTHLRISGIEYCAWAAGGKDTAVIDLLDEQTSELALRILDAFWSGREASLLIDPSPFYALALSGNGARTVVLAWLDTTLGQAYRRLRDYFNAQRIVDFDGTLGKPYPLRRLASAMVRDPNKQQPPPNDVAALLRFALAGTPLALDLLNQAVLRCRAEQGVRRDRAALIKMVLVSRGLIDGEGGRMESLDLENRDPAYLCGRLLAILDAIQRQALGNPNTTIIDRFYGSASSAPASVFGTLMRGAQPHLAKLRKDRHGAYVALSERLEQVTTGLKEFPPTLTLQQQGLFALGFYHQRGEDRRQARERAAARAANDDAEAAIEPA